MYCVLHFKIKLLDFKSSPNTKRMLNITFIWLWNGMKEPRIESSFEFKSSCAWRACETGKQTPAHEPTGKSHAAEPQHPPALGSCTAGHGYIRATGLQSSKHLARSVSLQQPFKHKAVLVFEITSQPIKKFDLNLLIMTLISHSILNIFNLLPTDNPSGKIQYHS